MRSPTVILNQPKAVRLPSTPWRGKDLSMFCFLFLQLPWLLSSKHGPYIYFPYWCLPPGVLLCFHTLTLIAISSPLIQNQVVSTRRFRELGHCMVCRYRNQQFPALFQKQEVLFHQYLLQMNKCKQSILQKSQ